MLGDPFSTFSLAINHTFAVSLNQKLQQVFDIPDGREAAIYRRYMAFANRSGISPNDPDGIQYTVIPSNTGLRIMGDILAHMDDIDYTPLERKPNMDELASAARNSIPLVTKLASFEKNVFNIIFRSIADSGGIHKSLIVVENAGKMYYQLKDPMLQSAINHLSKSGIREKIEKEKRAGCPARMRFEGNKSAIETLWNWYVDYTIQVSRPSTTIR